MREATITINGDVYNFKFGLGFLGEILHELNIDVSELMAMVQKNPFYIVPRLMHGSAKYYALRNKEDYNFSVEHFVDLIDDDGGVASKGMLSFIEAFGKSIVKDVPVQKGKSAGTKKK